MLSKQLVAAAGLLVLMTTTSHAQTSKGTDPANALEKLKESEAKQTSVSPEQLATVINKCKIAEQTVQRVVGLREAGNPHIQRGEGLLLAGMKDNPELSQVDAAKLREERIAIYERRPVAASKSAKSPEEGDSTSPAGPDSGQAEQPASISWAGTRGYGELAFVGCLAVLGVVTCVIVWQKARTRG